jgi:hypothetical protein
MDAQSVRRDSSAPIGQSPAPGSTLSQVWTVRLQRARWLAGIILLAGTIALTSCANTSPHGVATDAAPAATRTPDAAPPSPPVIRTPPPTSAPTEQPSTSPENPTPPVTTTSAATPSVATTTVFVPPTPAPTSTISLTSTSVLAIGASSPVATDRGGSWLLDRVPAGFQPVAATDDGGRREVLYQQGDANSDVYDAPLRVTVVDASVIGDTPRPPVNVDVNGRPAALYEMRDDGRTFGIAVTWRDELGRTVTVECAQLGCDAAGLAGGAVAVGRNEWRRQLRALAIDTRIGNADPTSVEVVLVDEVADGQVYRLVALVPGDYPVADPDQRLTCYRLDVDGLPGRPLCDERPSMAHTPQHSFVFGPAPAGVDEVVVQRMDRTGQPSADLPVATAVVAAGGPPGGFYVSAVPPDWCQVMVEAADGTAPRLLGPTGILPGDPGHDACFAPDEIPSSRESK